MSPAASATQSFALVLKKECPTCTMLAPLLETLQENLNSPLQVYVQDVPGFPENFPGVIDDTELRFSYFNNIEIVPTLIRFDGDKQEVERIMGWDRTEWRRFTGIDSLGEELAAYKPGCGSRTEEPGMQEKLQARFASKQLKSRRVELAAAEDDMEACFDRGWSDGLPVTPPSAERVLAMLAGSTRTADQVIGRVPPNNAECTIEKLAINCVMAGCKPEYFPTVIAAVEAALQDAFCMHGLLCTTYFSGPVVIVNGPVVKHIGMNSGVNALGQGNRANATIGRALQLLIRNVGGGIPGGIDRAAMGNPGKYTYCFAEDESDDGWPSLAMDRGYDRNQSVVHLFAGDGLQPVVDQQSRNPESLCKSVAASLRTVAHSKLYGLADAILVLSPEHRRVIRQSGWNKSEFHTALLDELMVPANSVLRGVDGIAEGMPEKLRDKVLCKFRDDGLHIVSTGGTAGMFSAIISGWVAAGEKGSQLVSQEVQ